MLAPSRVSASLRSLRDWQGQPLTVTARVAQEEVSAPGECRISCLTRGMRCVRWLTIRLSSVTMPVWYPIKVIPPPSSHPPLLPKGQPSPLIHDNPRQSLCFQP